MKTLEDVATVSARPFALVGSGGLGAVDAEAVGDVVLVVDAAERADVGDWPAVDHLRWWVPAHRCHSDGALLQAHRTRLLTDVLEAPVGEPYAYDAARRWADGAVRALELHARDGRAARQVAPGAVLRRCRHRHLVGILGHAHLDLTSRDVVFSVTIPDGTPISGEVRGKAAVIEHFERLGDLLEFRQERPMDFLGRGDRVVVLGTETMEIKETGATITGSEYADVLDFRDGLIARFLVIQDLTAVLDAYRRRDK
jgi:ketosteroid isomerase-like protein